MGATLSQRATLRKLGCLQVNRFLDYSRRSSLLVTGLAETLPIVTVFLFCLHYPQDSWLPATVKRFTISVSGLISISWSSSSAGLSVSRKEKQTLHFERSADLRFRRVVITCTYPQGKRKRVHAKQSAMFIIGKANFMTKCTY